MEKVEEISVRVGAGRVRTHPSSCSPSSPLSSDFSPDPLLLHSGSSCPRSTPVLSLPPPYPCVSRGVDPPHRPGHPSHPGLRSGEVGSPYPPYRGPGFGGDDGKELTLSHGPPSVWTTGVTVVASTTSLRTTSVSLVCVRRSRRRGPVSPTTSATTTKDPATIRGARRPVPPYTPSTE